MNTRLHACASRQVSALRHRGISVTQAPTDYQRPFPKGPTEEIISAILEMKLRNPRFGNQHIAEQISHAFGVQIDKDVVRRVLARHRCRVRVQALR